MGAIEKEEVYRPEKIRDIKNLTQRELKGLRGPASSSRGGTTNLVDILGGRRKVTISKRDKLSNKKALTTSRMKIKKKSRKQKRVKRLTICKRGYHTPDA